MAQAALLLRCQQRRDARLRAEQERYAAASAQAQTDLSDAEAIAACHAEDAEAATRVAYAGLAGRSVDPWAVLAVRHAEEAARERQLGLQQVADAAHDTLRYANAEENEARESRLAGARRLARRERVNEAAILAAGRHRIAIDEAQADEADLILRARRL